MTITLVPCLVVGFYATNQYVRSRVLALTEHRLQAEAELISYGLRQWGIGISQTVEALTETPAFREVRVAEIQSTLSAIVDDSDDRLWRDWSPSNPPKLLAHTGSMTSSRIADAQNNQMARDYFQAATAWLFHLSSCSLEVDRSALSEIFRSLSFGVHSRRPSV